MLYTSSDSSISKVYAVLATSLMYKLCHDPENNNVEEKKNIYKGE